MNTYKPNATIVTRAGGLGKAVWKFIWGYFGMGIGLFFLFGGNFSDWMSWVALVTGIVMGAGVFLERQAPCPYCHERLTFFLYDNELSCSKCEHRLHFDQNNKLLIPLDALPIPVQAASSGEHGSGGLGKVAAAGLAGLALGTLAGEATAEAEIPSETQGDIDLDDVDFS